MSQAQISLADVLPENPVYELDGDLATISVETGTRDKNGSLDYAEVTARLTASVDKFGEPMLSAEYVSHDGELSQDRIDWAVRAIETNTL